MKDENKRRKYKLKKQSVGNIFPLYYIIRINAFRPSVANALDEWMTFLKDNSIKDDTTAPGLVEAKEVLKRSNMSKEELSTYIRHLESMQNEKSAMRYSYASGKVDGREEGRAEGEKQKAIDIARNLKAAGLDIDFIAQNTGLTQDEIEKL